ncbi:hypothetical protein B1R32_10931 [Abditibacterium utsteinense]|uniref:Glycosyltransferase like family protein n=1 Tax=Abditibacterium utsteinense TaxID=1960156 RepID=A0A2S8SSA0_9BACT|nr:hypothetical protein [Abditibacterium utsteinense]PQV63692.1 hypothetical protein B1R32_10931 [Abditibacterium utsteinense]
MSKIFHICTLANNLSQYKSMKNSFLAAGFDEHRCRYTIFDNANSNAYEPYSAFNAASSETEETYLIFCHQDILIDQGHDINQLLKVLDELSKNEPNWAIAGNAGGTDTLKLVRRITDPYGSNTVGHIPRRVQSLDENFLVVNTRASLRCSSHLSGFHLHGTDLCLDAITKGFTCHVVDFHLTHLSPGNANQDFENAITSLQEVWNNKFKFCYVKTSCGELFLSKYDFLRKIFGSKKMINWVVNHPRFYTAFVFLRRRYQGKGM